MSTPSSKRPSALFGFGTRGDRAFGDPLPQSSNLRRRHFLLARRHLARRDALNQQALRRLARHDRPPPAAQVALGRLFLIQPQPDPLVPRVLPVTAQAAVRQDWPNISVELQWLRERGCGQKYRGGNGSGVHHSFAAQYIRFCYFLPIAIS